MAIGTNNTTLEAAVANWLNRSDLTSRVQEFIELGGARVRREQEWDRRVYSAETGNPFTFTAQGDALPTGIKAVKELWPTAGSQLAPLAQTTFAELRKLAASNLDATGTPSAYAIVPPRDPAVSAARLYLWPVPSGAYTVDFFYIRDVGPLGAGNELLAFAPDVYLYAALIHSAPFLKHDERVAIWRDAYLEAMASVNHQSEAAQHGASLQRASFGGPAFS